jgi:hypothetical protein
VEGDQPRATGAYSTKPELDEWVKTSENSTTTV